MKLLKKIYKKEIQPDIDYFFLCFSVFIFSILRIPSLVEPDWYGDEGIYQVIGRALNSGRILYKEIWDNKPPLLYVYYALVDGDLFAIKLLSLIFGAAAVIVFFFLAKRLFQNKRLPVFLSTFSFAVLFGLPYLEGNIANAENFMLFPIILSLYLITRMSNRSKMFLPVLAGLLLSVAFLTKIVAIFDLLAFVVILFSLRFLDAPFVSIQKNVKLRPREMFRTFKLEAILIVSFLIPIVLVSLYFLVMGAFKDYFNASFSQNIGYVGYGNYFLFPQGLLLVKFLILIIGVGVAFFLRKKIGAVGIIILMWLLFSAFNALFSGRPYTHYMLVMLPPMCLLFGALFLKLSIRTRVIYGVILIVVIVLLRNNFGFYNKIIPYYVNYVQFTLEQKSVEQYQAFFDRITPRDYEVARFIEANTSEEDHIFLISDSGQIYFLADKLPPGRYIVAYHITFYKDGISETKQALSKNKPKYIIVTKEGNLAQEFTQDYEMRYILGDVEIYEQK